MEPNDAQQSGTATVTPPTVGRIVHYHVADHDSAELRNNGVKLLPAVVTRTFADSNTVNLKIFADGPDDFWKTSVTMGEGPGQWSWPQRT